MADPRATDEADRGRVTTSESDPDSSPPPPSSAHTAVDSPAEQRPLPDGGYEGAEADAPETDRPREREATVESLEGSEIDAESERERTGDDEDVDERGEESSSGDETELTTDELRRRVEEKYDFDDFGPRDMAEMTPEEWDVAFDADSWITGDELLARVERELQNRIADRDVFAVIEYATVDGERSLIAYSDSDYAIVFPDGSVEGRGTVVRDVKPSVALCSMDSYEIDDPPENWQLPRPEEIPESGSELGNWMLQLLAGVQLLVGIATLVAWPILGMRDNLILLAAGLGFVFIGLILFAMVANARLSEKFRVQEYRDRLRSIGTASEERPDFLPIDDEAFETSNEPPQIDDRS